MKPYPCVKDLVVTVIRVAMPRAHGSPLRTERYPVAFRG